LGGKSERGVEPSAPEKGTKMENSYTYWKGKKKESGVGGRRKK